MSFIDANMHFTGQRNEQSFHHKYLYHRSPLIIQILNYVRSNNLYWK